jgi:molybdopterin-guanine dinucleotide biosynthesis protein A
MKTAPPLAGIFVGGASSRMGRPKGLLHAPGTEETLIERLVGVARASGAEPVLLGDAAPYAALAPDVPRLADRPEGIGPLGGLKALLDRAGNRYAISLACDMPYVDEDALRALMAVTDDQPTAEVVAARRGSGAPLEPMLALWHAPRVRPALAKALEEGVRSFQALFAALAVVELELTPALARALVDWDTPEDLGR